MSTPRRRPLAASITATLTGLASLSPQAGATTSPAAADCYTIAIDPELADDGQVSEVVCGPAPRLRAATMTLSTHYTGVNGIGSTLTVFGSSCSEVTVFSSGSAWNNNIESTRAGACGLAKHFDNSNLEGPNEITEAPPALQNLVTMGNRVSSIAYHA